MAEAVDIHLSRHDWGGRQLIFGDAGNDRPTGASGMDVLIGGSDSMHGGGGNDIFAFGKNWGGHDAVEQLADGHVTLWFESGSPDNWDAATLTYADGNDSVRVTGGAADQVTLMFGQEDNPYAVLSGQGVFAPSPSEKIFGDKDKGMLA